MPSPDRFIRMKMICPNPDCINKSAIYRRFDSLKVQTCKACNAVLVKYISKALTKQLNNARQSFQEINN